MTGAAPAAPLSWSDPSGGYDRDGRDDLHVVGLADSTQFVTFSASDTRFRESRRVTGLAGDVQLVGIDYRVQDGKLYGVGNAGGSTRSTTRPRPPRSASSVWR